MGNLGALHLIPQTGFLNLGNDALGTPEDGSMNVLLAHAERESRTRR